MEDFSTKTNYDNLSNYDKYLLIKNSNMKIYLPKYLIDHYDESEYSQKWIKLTPKQKEKKLNKQLSKYFNKQKK